MARSTGIVKWFSEEKGYGFITPERGGGKDCFVHFSAIRRVGKGRLNLVEGARVEYTEEPGTKGPQAVDVVSL